VKAAKVTVKVTKETVETVPTNHDYGRHSFRPVWPLCRPKLALPRLPMGFCVGNRNYPDLGYYRSNLPFFRHLAAGH
jgi:hypothetical protein